MKAFYQAYVWCALALLAPHCAAIPDDKNVNATSPETTSPRLGRWPPWLPTKCKPCKAPCSLVGGGQSVYCNCMPTIIDDGEGTVGIGKRDESKPPTKASRFRPAKCLETVY